ncbi:MAG: uroporphyrinogen-III C-methyltransferase [bacterium]|nr:uroporphyrinogen-III C-methyltransferase [bacterium]
MTASAQKRESGDDRPGTVYLVGAGPGDPELITVRGLRLLQAADVVVHDRLITPELLDEVRCDAEIIDVGKHPGFQRFTQEEINDLLVDRARSGRTVVRLKGGDPFIFGRGSEEVLHCSRAGMPTVVVPGVSSAHGVPAAAGIPLTHRGLGRSYAVITGRTDPTVSQPDIPYRALAEIHTIAILMGRSNLDEIASGLIAAGRPPTTPAACIEMGCTPRQRSVFATLETIADIADREGLKAPVVTVVGEAVTLGIAQVSRPADVEVGKVIAE